MDGPLEDAFVRGEPVPLEKMRDIARLARKSSVPASEMPHGIVDASGLAGALPSPPGFWARITAQLSVSQPLYSFWQVVDDGTGSGWQAMLGGYFSDSFQAFETSGNTAVPADPVDGAVVWMQLSDLVGDEGWRFQYVAPVALLQVNARTPDGSGHYDASVLSVDPATGTATVHESCWFVAPGTAALPVGAIFLGRYAGTYSSRNVYANHGPLIVELDSGSPAIATTFLDLHDPTFLPPDEVSLGSGHARVRLNWGTNIQPVGTHNLPGISERPARADHVHAFAIPATTDPPSDTTGTTNIYNTATNMLWVYVTAIGWVPICPCPGWSPPFLSGSGTGSGVGGGGGVVTSCCSGAVIPQTLYAAFTPTDDCECLAAVTVPLDYDPDFQDWRYAGPLCGQTVLIVFYCYDNPSWALEISFTSGSIANTDGPVSCVPFLWPESAFDLNFDGICAGFARVTISA
jgi:hypothetical protein